MSIPKYNNPNIPKSQQTKDSSKYPQGYFKKKPCKACNETFQPYAPSEKYCSNPCKDEGVFTAYLKRVYNLSISDYRSMYTKQKGLCKICNEEGFAMKGNLKLVIDHCHTTGKVRGLLCHNCNRALGLLKDNINSFKKAIKYLKEGKSADTY